MLARKKATFYLCLISRTAEVLTQLETTNPGAKIVEALADEFSDLDKTMEEINDSLVGMEDVEVSKSANVGSADELSDDDTDSEDDEGVCTWNTMNLS